VGAGVGVLSGLLAVWDGEVFFGFFVRREWAGVGFGEGDDVGLGSLAGGGLFDGDGAGVPDGIGVGAGEAPGGMSRDCSSMC
jgi:hypothetical protein